MSIQSVRPLTPHEIDRLLPLCQAFCAEDGHLFDPARVRAGLEGLTGSSPYGTTLVQWSDQRPVAYAVLTLGWSLESGGIDALLDEVYVEPALRRRGLGQALIERAVEHARQVGARRIYLEVEAGNDDAARLYHRLGWRAEDSQMMLRWLDPEPEDRAADPGGGRISG